MSNTSSSNVLPKYACPPVAEVAMGVHFPALSAFGLAHLGLFAQRAKERGYPRLEQHPPIPFRREPLAGGFTPPQIGFRLSGKPEVPRTWFLDEAGNHVIQVQQDMYLHNWRRVTDTDKYPSFENVRDSFVTCWADFRIFLGDYAMEAVPDQCQLTYVNQAPKGNGWESPADWAKLFTAFNWQPKSGFLPSPECVGWFLTWPLEQNMGRLYMELAPAATKDNQPVLRWEFTARGQPVEPTDEGIAGWYEVAHRWIVKAFADLNTEKADALWSRQQ